MQEILKGLAPYIGGKISLYIALHSINLPNAYSNIYYHLNAEIREPLADWYFTVNDLVRWGTTPDDHLNADDTSKVEFDML